ncbi:MAG: cupredoxin domain-containing protein [Nitriliruptorales bacterium]
MTSAAATLDMPHPRLRAIYTRIVVLGLLTMATGLLVVLIGSRFEAVGFVAPFMAVVLLVTALAWRFGTWAKILAATVGLALLAMNAPFLVPSLGYPSVFFEFVPAVMFIVGSLTAAAGGVAAVAKRRDRRAEASVGERRFTRAILGVLAVLAVISGVLALTVRTTVSAADRAGSVAVGIRDFEFSPSGLQAQAGQPVKFVVHNGDTAWHTFTVPGLVDQTVLPGSDQLIEFTPPESGTLIVYCRPHADATDGFQAGQDMFTTIAVE